MPSTSVYQRVAADLLARDPSIKRVTAAPPQPVVQTRLTHSQWFSDGAVYVNRESGKRYRPHNEQEREFVFTDGPRRYLLRGGEGSGKSVAGIIKDLERLRRGMSGIMGSPDFVHFRKSLWREFQRWCPPNALVAKHRYRLDLDWHPNQPFELVFVSGATLLCGGFDNPGSWEGPNVSFGHFDEGRNHARPTMAKVLDGRCRIPGPNGEPPQWWITSTPRKSKLPGAPEDLTYHWLYEMFGPWDREGEDPFAAFKANAKDVILRLEENAENLAEGYVTERRQSLTAAEARILADAEWEEDDDTKKFLLTMQWWDACQTSLPPLDDRTPVVIAVDAAIGREATASDCFGIVVVAPYDRTDRNLRKYAIRDVYKWQALPGQVIDYRGTETDPGPERVLETLCDQLNVKCITYDKYQLVFVMQKLERTKRVWCAPFSQQGDRMVADKALLDAILQIDILHDGNPDLRQHIANADRKVDAQNKTLRLVQGRGKIDLAVCTSMGRAVASELNL